jgi:hypothetical protein
MGETQSNPQASLKALSVESTPVLTYSKVAESSSIHIVDSEVNKAAKAVVNQTAVSTKVATLISNDADTNSRNIPYYRNPRKGIWSTFENPPDVVRTISAVNILVLDRVPNQKLNVVKYDDYRSNPSASTSKVGFGEQVNILAQELIILLQLKDDLDYENTVIKQYSDLLKFILNKIKTVPRTGNLKDADLQFTPQEHVTLQRLLNTSSDSIVYRCTLQTIYLLACTIEVVSSPYHSLICRAIDGKVSNLPIRRQASDLNIDPLYQWSCILSPWERQQIVLLCGIDVFRKQSQLLDKYRRSSSEAIRLELLELNKTLKTRVPEALFAVIYGRMKQYHSFKNKAENKDKTNVNKSANRAGQIPYSKLLRYMSQEGKLDLFSEETFAVVIFNCRRRATEIADLTRFIQYDAELNIMYYTGTKVSNSRSLQLLRQEAKSGKKESQDFLKFLGSKVRGRILDLTNSDFDFSSSERSKGEEKTPLTREKKGKAKATPEKRKDTNIRYVSLFQDDINKINDRSDFLSRFEPIREAYRESGNEPRLDEMIQDFLDSSTYEDAVLIINSALEYVGTDYRFNLK